MGLAWKIRLAAEKGAVGVLSFGNLVGPEDAEEAKGLEGLEGAVRRESVLLGITPGDVMSPNVPADGVMPGIDPTHSPELPPIPSIPLSLKSAKHLLQTLSNHGSLLPEPTTWPDKHKPSPFYEPPSYFSGTNSTSSPTIHLTSHPLTKPQPIWNVHTSIKGIEDSLSTIYLTAPRTSFCAGASSSASPTAVLLGVARVFSQMYAYGWRPLRTIQFISFDGSELGGLGAVEHVEAHRDEIRKGGLAVINLAGVSGSTFTASGHPALHGVLKTVLSQTAHPETKAPLTTTWSGRDLTSFPMVPGTSDASPFQSHAGVFALDLGFKGPVDLRGSCMDTHERLVGVETKEFALHHTLAEVVALLLLQLADTQQLPLSLRDYSLFLSTRLSELQTWVGSLESYPFRAALDFKPLRESLRTMQESVSVFEVVPDSWQGNGESWEWESQRGG
ncbi:Zn-dependent exopeptidase [Ascobolus immersus RN42]|uniref:Peptide hydrolase n=1 Tax=Ascobolus immersus RN42 TaxID=1160509 RepID=A0A3N4HL15_ASCIM|nr:Zn-dependent exopeptidase [Ascobolus immersus RN42]